MLSPNGVSESDVIMKIIRCIIGSEMKYHEISLDLETVSTDPKAAIISIGAVKFNLEDVDTVETLRKPDRTFYRTVSLESSIAHGGHMSADTVRWWMKQSNAAKTSFDGEFVITDVLVDLAQFFDLHEFIEGSEERSKYVLWGNGSDFDNVVLNEAYKTAWGYSPIDFRLNADLRTAKKLALKIQPKTEFKTVPGADTLVPHSALDDAIFQALLAQRYWRILNMTNIATDTKD